MCIRDRYYIDGNAVRKLQTAPEKKEKRAERQVSHEARKNRAKALRMSRGYVLFLALVLSLIHIFIISIDGKVKLSDFGIARATSSNTISTNMMGSVHYSSPEQVRGGYSCLLYTSRCV